MYKNKGIVIDSLSVLFLFSWPLVTWLAFQYPPVIVSQGQAHRIFYIHVPVAWVALYAPLLSAVAGLAYLVFRRQWADRLGAAAGYLSFLFALGVVVSGALWAKTEWGTYWNWKDSRLMSFFVLLLCQGGYIMVRFFTDDIRRRGVYSAGMGMLAALAAVLTWYAIRLIEPDTHPTSVMGSMSPEISRTFWYSVLGYHLVFLALLRLTYRFQFAMDIKERIINTVYS